MASSKRAERTSETGTSSGAARASTGAPGASADAGFAGTRDQAGSTTEHASGPVAATPIERATISCLTNAQYHSCREAFLDTTHRWFMFLVIALGAVALTDVLPKLLHATFGVTLEAALLKEMCAAGAAILAALDLTFDLSNRARSHAMMKRRYYELLGDLREGLKTPEAVGACLERFSADEEPAYRVLHLACWNAAQQTVYGDKAMRFEISTPANWFKNWWRRPAANYPVGGG